MTARLAFPALAAALLSAPAVAADRFYPLDPATWALYSVTASPPAILGPAAAGLVTPFKSGAARGSVGPAGYNRGGGYTTGLHVAPGALAQFPILYRYLSGDHGAHVCIDGHVTGYPVHQCLDFDGQTGTFNSAGPAIVSYSIAPYGTAGWLYVSITVRTAATFEYGNQAFPYIQANPGQRFAVCCAGLITEQAP